MYLITITNQFKKDLRKLEKQNKDLTLLKEVKDLILSRSKLPKKYRNHQLVGNHSGYWELHIQPDWLLIYKLSDNELKLVRTGSHAELF
jgi:mRNA interferase YafQ